MKMICRNKAITVMIQPFYYAKNVPAWHRDILRLVDDATHKLSKYFSTLFKE